MKNTYEILFLFDPTVGANWETVEGEINRLMERAEAEIIMTKRLEERRLAFEINGRKRGLYAITYFKADGEKMTALERDARLSEMVLRILILRADGISLEKMQAVTLGAGHDAKPGREFDGRDNRDSRDSRDSRDGRRGREHEGRRREEGAAPEPGSGSLVGSAAQADSAAAPAPEATPEAG